MNQTSRSVSIQEVVDALVTIRDQIVTDENIDTVVGVIDKMKTMLYSIYTWISKEDLPKEDILKVASEAGITDEMNAIVNLPEEGSRNISSWWNSFTSVFAGREAAPFSVTGLIGAIVFIRDHLAKSDTILSDITSLFEALQTVQFFSDQEDEDTSARSLDFDKAKVTELYQQLT